MSRAVDALVGAATGAVIGAVVLTGVVTVDRAVNLNAVAVQPIATTSTQAFPQRSMASSRQSSQRSSVQVEQVVVETQATPVYSWAFVALTAVAGAVNGLFLLSNRRMDAASTTGRREALPAGVAAAGLTAGPAIAAYGDWANEAQEKELLLDVEVGSVWSMAAESGAVDSSTSEPTSVESLKKKLLIARMMQRSKSKEFKSHEVSKDRKEVARMLTLQRQEELRAQGIDPYSRGHSKQKLWEASKSKAQA